MTRLHQLDANRMRSYAVSLVDGLLEPGSPHLEAGFAARRALIVTTPTVAELYGDDLQTRLSETGADVSTLVIDVDEREKDLSQVECICQRAQEKGLDRDGVLVGFGGGVCTDLTTVAASWLRRGIGHVRIPTTLIGQIDAGIGIKGALNFKGKKNYLGSFYPPERVLIDPMFLRTLPTHHVRAGFAEIIKIALIRDASVFRLIEQHSDELLRSRFAQPHAASREVLWKAILRMLEELQPNIHEDQTCKRLVDFGHTFSPSVESAADFEISHGEAVAIDMALSSAIACELGHLSAATRDRVVAALVAVELPIYTPLLTAELCDVALTEAVAHRRGAVNLVLPTDIGEATFLEHRADLPPEVLNKSISWLAAMARPAPSLARPAARCLVFDVGGTSIRAALYHQESDSVSSLMSQPTPSSWTLPAATAVEIRERLLHQMQCLGSEVLNGQQPDHVSLAFPGPVDASGNVLAAPTVWGSACEEPVDLIAELKKLWPSARISLLNDVTAAGYRYLRHEHDDLCVVTVSSGIGNKVFVAGSPVTGPAARGGEIGHLRVDFADNAAICDCGGRGHLGAIASGRGTLLLARRLSEWDPLAFQASMLAAHDLPPDPFDNQDIASAFRAGDPWTRNLIRQVAQPLGRTLASIHLSTGNERFVIVGGFALALGEGYREELVEAASQSGWQIGQDWDSMIELGDVDDRSGVIGAGRFATAFAGDA